MLARWLDREGLGQILAPDETAAKKPVPEEGYSFFWQLVAPDPRFQSRSEPPASAKGPPPSAFWPSVQDPSGKQVQCMHCKQWTPISIGDTAAAPTTTTTTSHEDNILRTPMTPPVFAATSSSSSNRSELEDLVMLAAKDTAVSMNSPSAVAETRNKVFRLCGSTKPLNEKLVHRLRNILTRDPSLIHARATHLGNLVPDGYTCLMAAVHADNKAAAEIILQLSPQIAHLERDLQGRTALHIAAELGHMNMVHLLVPKYQKEGLVSPPPVDLLGRTPLGRAVTSPHPTARKRQKELEKVLFSPGDVSILGNPKPIIQRTWWGDANLQMAYGIADMPGMRVTMEDAICSFTWQRDNKSYCLLGVCDGHGDRGLVSKYIADNIPSVLQSNMLELGENWDLVWRATCLTVDANLKQAELAGGSTAVLALITSDAIVVANVGDSRSILIQAPAVAAVPAQTTLTGLEESVEKMSVSAPPQEEQDEGYPPAIDQGHPEKATPETESQPLLQLQQPPTQQGPVPVVVKAMSDDHKPNLEHEQERIEKAGMKVAAVTFQEDGKDVTIHKVQRSETDQLAVSRAFGDFEYKSNVELGPDEQAVTAVPDVVVHARDPAMDSYLVLACDGVWDVMSNEEVAKFVVRQIELRADMSNAVLPEVGDALLTECLNRGSRDNMSVAIVALSKAVEQVRARPLIHGKALDFASPRK
jgi:serine/threonine protein phosphatase PrpC